MLSVVVFRQYIERFPLIVLYKESGHAVGEDRIQKTITAPLGAAILFRFSVP